MDDLDKIQNLWENFIAKQEALEKAQCLAEDCHEQQTGI